MKRLILIALLLAGCGSEPPKMPDYERYIIHECGQNVLIDGYVSNVTILDTRTGKTATGPFHLTGPENCPKCGGRMRAEVQGE